MQKLEKILEEVKDALKDTYLDIANNYDVSDLRYDSDKVACVAGKFRSESGSRIEDIISKYMYDGWIPVQERLPEEKKSVLVQWEKYDRHLNVTLTYLDVMWLDDAEEKVFETINGVPNGKVIAWRPLPEPYSPERSNNHDREGSNIKN